jgi:PIN domain nuclease of toxin-antitoxin system
MPFVTDTHSLLWHMTDDPRLSLRVKNIFDKDYVVIPCIVFFELLYLLEKKKIVGDFDGFLSMVSASENYRVEPLCLPVIEKSRRIPREVITDPWDRLIAATSMHLQLPLMTRDVKLKRIGVNVVW